MECQYCCYYLVFMDCLLCHYVLASDWPEGYYGLPMAKTGCPAGATFRWKTGWIYQDTEDDYPQSSRSTTFHIEGQVTLSSVNRSFCMKTDYIGDDMRPHWPSGTYCIYKRKEYCPVGFISGSVQWDDENDNNQNDHQGILPRTTLSKWRTKILFCCRSDGPKETPIDLPTASPFYLLAHEYLSCQQIRWAVATSEWIYYDTEDDYHNYDSVKNPAPYIPGGKGTGHKVYYCYYTSCQYSLNTSTGSIESPRFPGNYSDGQECSWKISVGVSQTIVVYFVNFSLADINDSLTFHNGTDDNAPVVATLHGESKPSDIARVLRFSASNIFVVFYSNEVGNSTGFKAIFSTTDTTTIVPPVSSTQAPPTTKETIKTTETPSTMTETPMTTEKTNPTEIGPSSHNPPSKSSSEPSSLPKWNSSNYDAFKKTCIQQSQSTLTAVAIVIPLICLIAVIAMAVYLFLRLRKLREKPSDVPLRYTTTTESVNNPAYVPSDAVIEARAPSTNIEYEDNKGDIYHEIEPSRQTTATDNPLYQSTDEDKHVYASFA